MIHIIGLPTTSIYPATLLNNATIAAYSTLTEQQQIAMHDSGFVDISSIPDITSISAGEYITVDVDNIGTTVAGADTVIIIEWI